MALATSALKDLIFSIVPGYKSPDDDFFNATNKAYLPTYKKLGVITAETEDIETTCSGATIEVDCNVPGCKLSFENVQDYQSHYNTQHRFLCATCKKVLPTPHLLDLHISENHDSFFKARVERGDAMYCCYLEECKQLMLTPAERKDHCIKIHNFPANFRFDKITAEKQFKSQSTNKMDVDMPEPKDAAKKVKAFNFGHGKERSFNKQCLKPPTAGSTLENMKDLQAALEE